jgi:hypothetical protein
VLGRLSARRVAGGRGADGAEGGESRESDDEKFFDSVVHDPPPFVRVTSGEAIRRLVSDTFFSPVAAVRDGASLRDAPL